MAAMPTLRDILNAPPGDATDVEWNFQTLEDHVATQIVNRDGSVSSDGGSNPATGYSLIEASNLDDAIAKAKGCPILAAGGSVELAEAIDM